MSFKGKDRPVMRRDMPVKATQSPLGGSTRGSKTGDSLVSLQNDISDLIEKSFGEKILDEDMMIVGGDKCDGPSCKVDLAKSELYKEKTEETEMCNKMENISFTNRISPQPEPGKGSSSPNESLFS